MIDPTFLGIALDALHFKPRIDLFASRLNRQFPIYCSFKPDPDASYIDAFTLSWSDKNFYCFPPFSCVLQSASKNHPGQSNRDNGCSNVANTIMVPNSDVPSCSSTNHSPPVQESTESSCISRGKPSTAQKDESSYLSTIRQQLEGLGFTSRSIAVIVASWREGTTSQYQTYLQKWLEFCKQKHCDVLPPPLPLTLDFLSMLYEKGLSYSTINTATSMLSSILQLNVNSSIPFGQLPIVPRFMKGLFKLRPALPRYKSGT